MYPNPANEVLNLSNLDGKVDVAEIMSLDGKTLLSVNLEDVANNYTLDVSGLTSGVYVLSLESSSSNLKSTRRIIIE